MRSFLALICCWAFLAAPLPPGNQPPRLRVHYPIQPGSRLTLPILMYHHLRVLGRGASATWRDMTVTPADFGEEMAYLAGHDYHTISFADLQAHLDTGKALPENPVILTFDDGWKEQYEVAFPILRKYGMTATFFVPSEYPTQVGGALSWDQIVELSQAGMEFGSHTVSHPYLTKEDPKTLRRELEDSRATLEQHLGKPVTVLAYPYGLYDAEVITAAEDAGYTMGVTIKPGAEQRPYTPFQIRRTDVQYGIGLQAFTGLLVMKTP